ncbi:MAG: DinB family protein, partial [Burkholderiaceae bacterium]
DVVSFLGLKDDTAPELSPPQLIERYNRILNVAVKLVAQMPDDTLGNLLPDRPRSWLVLMHHVFQIPVAFLDTERTGESLTYESFTAEPPAEMTSSVHVASFGETVRLRFKEWGADISRKDLDEYFSQTVPTYYGDTSRHEVLERTVWHSTQHVRQVASLLELAGVDAGISLGSEDLVGLPLTEKIWDSQPS